MIEKWMLVLLIVGGTSLVFIICFPIDFYLYRRRKRMARERNKFPNFEPKPAARAGQCHANVAPKSSLTSVWVEDIKRKQVTSKGGFARVVSMIRKKQQEEKLAKQIRLLAASGKLENTSDTTVLSETPDTLQTLIPPEIRTQTTHVVTTHAVQNDRPSERSFDTFPNADDTFPAIPQRRLSNVSAAWSENEELMDHENKHLNYGALQSLSNITNLVGTSKRQQTCYTIPMVRQTSLTLVRSGDTATESNTDTDEMQVSSASEHRYSPNDAKQDFVYNSSNFGHVKYSKMFANCTSESDVTKQNMGRHTSTTSNESSEDYNVNEPILKASRSITLSNASLERSASEQNIWTSRHSKSRPNFKSGKKRNIVTPTDRILSGSIDQFCIQETELVTSRDSADGLRDHYKSTDSVASSRSKKKRRKGSRYLKRQSSDSLPDLSSLQDPV